MDLYNCKHFDWFTKRRCFMTYKINLTLEFKTRPTKAEVEDKLFCLIRDGFTLKTKEEHEREKQLVGKRQSALPKP